MSDAGKLAEALRGAVVIVGGTEFVHVSPVTLRQAADLLTRQAKVVEVAAKLRAEIHGIAQWVDIIARDIGWTNWNCLMQACDALGDALNPRDVETRT